MEFELVLLSFVGVSSFFSSFSSSFSSLSSSSFSTSLLTVFDSVGAIFFSSLK